MVKKIIQILELKILNNSKSFQNLIFKLIYRIKITLNIKNIKIPLLGIHNIRNSVGALGVALTVGIPIQKIKKGTKKF